jgi:hypothetical protein
VRSSCGVCHPEQHLFRLARNATRRAFLLAGRKKTRNKTDSTETWIGCSASELRHFIDLKMQHWNEQYLEQMHPENVEIDHIKPISSATCMQELLMLTHFTNLQPLLKRHNASKSAHWSEQDDTEWRLHVIYNTTREEVYWPHSCPPLNALGVEWKNLALLAEVCER